MCILYHSLTWSTYQVASRKKGYWKWITSQIKCPCRPQIQDDLCRGNSCLSSENSSTWWMPMCETFILSALSLLFLPRLCRLEISRWRGCMCSITEHPEVFLLQTLRAQPAVQFWKPVVFILTAKGKIFRSYSFSKTETWCSWRWGWGKQFHGDVKWLCDLYSCLLF